MPTTKTRRQPRATKTAKTAKAKPKARSGPVVVKRRPLEDLLHPTILAAALEHAAGDTRLIEVRSYTNAVVTIPTSQRKAAAMAD